MKVTYIHHSCFLAETESCYYLFDYFKGELPALDPQKPILVLSSHKHADHYHPSVFALLKDMGMEQIHAVLSRDISGRTVPGDIPLLSVASRRTYSLPQGQKLSTYLSTDKGVAFLIRDKEECFYHAGDLNDWVWEEESDSYNRQMTGSYRKEIDTLAQDLDSTALTAAFVVLDPRQENDYARGMLYFLKKISCDRIYPMHYWEQPEIITRFLTEYPQYQNRILLTESTDAK
ncbi:MAG: MBL fold metallo-hydrolase [Bariatricus sp.]